MLLLYNDIYAPKSRVMLLIYVTYGAIYEFHIHKSLDTWRYRFIIYMKLNIEFLHGIIKMLHACCRLQLLLRLNTFSHHQLSQQHGCFVYYAFKHICYICANSFFIHEYKY